MKKSLLLLVAFGLVVAACGSSASVEGAFGSPEIDGDRLPALPADGADPAEGMTIPRVAGQDFDGNQVVLDPADGRAKVILFLAHWCPHCQAEVPVVQAYFDSAGLPDEVEFVSVATSTDPNRPNFPPQDWLAREGWTQPVIVDDEGGSVATAYGLTAFPFWVIVGPDGTVLQRVTGSINPEALPGLIDQLASMG